MDGNHNVTCVPSSGELTICIAPPDCAANPCTIDKPSPEPWPGFLVVKKGSKACASVASFIPAPVSDTVTTTKSPVARCDGALPVSTRRFSQHICNLPPVG